MWTAITGLINLLPAQLAKEIADDVIDKVENYAVELNSAKGAAIMAGCNFVRQVTNIPDDIGGDED